MPPVELFPTRAAALDAAMAEVRSSVEEKVRACVELVGGRGFFRVTAYLRSKQTVKRYRWTSGEAA